MARAYDVALVVRFVPFSQFTDWVSGTPFLDRGISSNSLRVPSFEEEQETGALERRISNTLYDVDFKTWKQDIYNLTAPKVTDLYTQTLSTARLAVEEKRPQVSGFYWPHLTTTARLAGEGAIPDTAWRLRQEEEKKKQGTFFGEQGWGRIADYSMLLAGAIVQQTPLPERTM